MANGYSTDPGYFGNGSSPLGQDQFITPSSLLSTAINGPDMSSYNFGRMLSDNPVTSTDYGSYQIRNGSQLADTAQNTAYNNDQYKNLTNSYNNVLNGTAPSVAQTQLGMGQSAAQQQMAAAMGARPAVNQGLQNRNLLNAQANLAAQGNQSAALLRAQEQDAARTGLGNLSTQNASNGVATRLAANQQAFSQNQAQTQANMQYRADLNNQQQAQRQLAMQQLINREGDSSSKQNSLIGAAGSLLGAIF